LLGRNETESHFGQNRNETEFVFGPGMRPNHIEAKIGKRPNHFFATIGTRPNYFEQPERDRITFWEIYSELFLITGGYSAWNLKRIAAAAAVLLLEEPASDPQSHLASQSASSCDWFNFARFQLACARQRAPKNRGPHYKQCCQSRQKKSLCINWY
jgi:hypothetical protein